MKNPVAASAILALMFASLLVIYVVVPQNDLVTYLSVVIMAIGLVIAFVGDVDEIMMLAGLAGLVSLVAAFFAGQARFGNIGGIVAVLAWGLTLFLVARRASTETVVIPEDHAFMIAPFLSSQAQPLTSPVPISTLPYLDRHVATIPTYELVNSVDVHDVNLWPTHNVKKVVVQVRYNVVNPSYTLRGIPNRGQIQSDVARDMSLSLSKARLDVAFWEKLLVRQMKEEVDDVVRQVLFRESVLVERQGSTVVERQDEGSTAGLESDSRVFYKWGIIDPLPDGLSQNLELAYKNRIGLALKVQKELQKLVERWGVHVKGVALESFEVDPMILRGLKGDAPFQGELDRERRKREGEARTEALRIRETGTARAETIRILIEEVKKTHPELDSIDVAEIVKAALLAGYSEVHEVEQYMAAQAANQQQKK
jgi:hypothetical protein